MTFVREDIPEDQMYLFQQNFHYFNQGGEPIYLEDRIIDRERDMFLVCPGSAVAGKVVIVNGLAILAADIITVAAMQPAIWL